MKKGYVQVYTGNGKGKTTAALGLALRAYGAGLSVFIGQFTKGQKYSEINALEKLSDLIKVEQFGRADFVDNKPTEADSKLVVEGWNQVVDFIQKGSFDVIILDELNIAMYYDLIAADDVVHVLKNKNPGTEVIITGRYFPQEIMEFADLVTEMKEIKHYYEEGVLSRRGIEF